MQTPGLHHHHHHHPPRTGDYKTWNYNGDGWSPLSQINVVVKLKYKEGIQFDCKLPVNAEISDGINDRDLVNMRCSNI